MRVGPEYCPIKCFLQCNVHGLGRLQGLVLYLLWASIHAERRQQSRPPAGSPDRPWSVHLRRQIWSHAGCTPWIHLQVWQPAGSLCPCSPSDLHLGGWCSISYYRLMRNCYGCSTQRQTVLARTQHLIVRLNPHNRCYTHYMLMFIYVSLKLLLLSYLLFYPFWNIILQSVSL